MPQIIHHKELLSREEYYDWLKKLPVGYCPFCDSKNNTVIKSGLLWNLELCLAPYWRYHFLLVPKRHIKVFSEINPAELTEFFEMVNSTMATLEAANLKHLNGEAINRYLFFWRYRGVALDSLYNVFKPDHFHFHIVPEKEHLWDLVADKEATKIDLAEVRKIFK